jgi:trk system potassium uptake protein TrkA
MGINQTYAVFGLGRYGRSVAKELAENGAEVVAVDNREAVVNAAISEIPYCKCADVTDPEALRQIGIANIDVVIVTMANHLEASVMATMLCKELGVKTVIAKCSTEINCKILTKVGADRVVFPESESGIHLAKNLLSSGFMDIIELSQDVSMVEMEVKQQWIGKNLIELNLRKKYSINVVAIIEGKNVNTNIDPEEPLTQDMRLIVIANRAKLNKLK